MADSAMLRAALSYLARGWSVIPAGMDKRPRGAWAEYEERQPTEEEVRAWWARRPEPNVAIVTGAVSGIVVLDLDCGHAAGVDGLQSIRAAGL